MNFLLLTVLAAFGFTAGTFLGSGNYQGLIGALIPGIVAGLFVSVPSLREQDWSSVGLLVSFAILGSAICAQLSDQNALKRVCREQTFLVVHLGSYKLGGSDCAK